jgi:hypothetical protein
MKASKLITKLERHAEELGFDPEVVIGENRPAGGGFSSDEREPRMFLMMRAETADDGNRFLAHWIQL